MVLSFKTQIYTYCLCSDVIFVHLLKLSMFIGGEFQTGYIIYDLELSSFLGASGHTDSLGVCTAAALTVGDYILLHLFSHIIL